MIPKAKPESTQRGGGGGGTGGKGPGGAIVPVDFGQLASVDGLRWSCRAAHRGTGRSRRRSLAGLARVARVWGTLGELVGGGEVGGPVADAAVRLGVAGRAIVPGRH